MGCVAASKRRAEGVTLDGVGKNHGGLAGVFHRCLVGCVDLAVVMAATTQIPNLLVTPVLNHRLGAWIATKEVLTHVRAVVCFECLVVAVQGVTHQVDEGVILVSGEQLVPSTAPEDLDDVPACTLEECLQLLDDLSVTAHGTVEALQVAVDDKCQVVQALDRCHLQEAAGFWLIHLTITEECPGVLVAGVFEAAKVQVAVNPRLVDGGCGAEAERNGRVLPEPVELAGMGV